MRASDPEAGPEALPPARFQGGAPACPSRRRALPVLVAALAASGCSPVRLLNALAPDRLFAAGIPYGTDPRQLLDIYRPAGAGPFPVLVFLYGGGWNSGSRAMYRFVGGAFAAHGFLVVIPDYRLFPEVRWRDILFDCAAALAWTRANAARFGGADRPPALIGHSAGAYNAAMLALDPARLRRVGLDPARDLFRVVGLAGPYDFLPLHTATLREIFGPGPATAATQPITYVDGRNPPMLLLAGTADQTVLPSNTVRLAERIRRLDGPVRDRLYPGVNHVEIVGAIAGPLRMLAPTFRDCIDFLRS